MCGIWVPLVAFSGSPSRGQISSASKRDSSRDILAAGSVREPTSGPAPLLLPLPLVPAAGTGGSGVRGPMVGCGANRVFT